MHELLGVVQKLVLVEMGVFLCRGKQIVPSPLTPIFVE